MSQPFDLSGINASKLIEQLEAEKKRREEMPQSPAALGRMVMGKKWKDAKHIQFLDEKLVALAKGDIKRLIVTCPPRHGKSFCCSIFFPAWYIGTYPDRKFISCSGSDMLAIEFSAQARNILREYGPSIFGISIDEGSQAKKDWKIAKHGGGLLAAGVGSQIQGRGGYCISIDDPFRSAKDANSQLIRDNIWTWWNTDAYSRLEPEGSALVIHTRFHQDDFIGRLLRKQDGDEVIESDVKDEPWYVVNFPAIAEEEDSIGRKVGEALWPERFPIDTLKRRRTGMMPYTWSSLWQQRPTPESGEVFRREWFRYYRKEDGFYKLFKPDGSLSYAVHPEQCTRIAAMDVASTEEQTSDFTCMGVFDITPSYDMILVDYWHARLQSPDVINTAAALARKHGVSVLGVEKNGVGLGVFQSLKQKGIPVRPLTAKGDKKTRTLVSSQARFASGMVFFREGDPNNDAIEYELLSFPKGEHDDCVDMCSWASTMVQDMGGVPRDCLDKAYESELDRQHAEGTESHTSVGSRIDQVSTQDTPSDDQHPDVKTWLSGGWLKFCKPSVN